MKKYYSSPSIDSQPVPRGISIKDKLFRDKVRNLLLEHLKISLEIDHTCYNDDDKHTISVGLSWREPMGDFWETTGADIDEAWETLPKE